VVVEGGGSVRYLVALYRIMDIVKYTHSGMIKMARSTRDPSEFRTDEAARRIGCSRSTLLRWFREGKIADVKRDRRGWRVFSGEDIGRIRRWAAGEEGTGR
jgi:excisionase family DNA binding protein